MDLEMTYHGSIIYLVSYVLRWRCMDLEWYRWPMSQRSHFKVLALDHDLCRVNWFTLSLSWTTDWHDLLGQSVNGTRVFYSINRIRPGASLIYSTETAHKVWWFYFVGIGPRINISYCSRVISCTRSQGSQSSLYRGSNSKVALRLSKQNQHIPLVITI